MLGELFFRSYLLEIKEFAFKENFLEHSTKIHTHCFEVLFIGSYLLELRS